jgi:hypothetical protein
MTDTMYPARASAEGSVLSHEKLIAAIEHLYKALRILESVKRKLADGGVMGAELSLELADGWLEVNCCRKYTEPFLFAEELLIPSLGLINDAKSMIDSCMAWKLGITRHAYLNIMNCLQLAIDEGIRPVLDELESWFHED